MTKWYNDKSDGLGKKFKIAVIESIDNLKSDFIEYGAMYKGLSRVFVKRYPYTVYLKKNHIQKVITVYAVLQKKQDRSTLDKRV